MHYRQFLFLVFLAFYTASCDSTPTDAELAQKEINTLKKEIMASHDSTMAQMNTMAKLRNQLKEAKADTTAAPEDTLSYHESYRLLMAASNGMMDWMAQFENPDNQTISDSAKIDYLNRQKELMYALEKDTEQAISKAKQLLEEQG